MGINYSIVKPVESKTLTSKEKLEIYFKYKRLYDIQKNYKNKMNIIYPSTIKEISSENSTSIIDSVNNERHVNILPRKKSYLYIEKEYNTTRFAEKTGEFPG
jgi:hypothetical protein